MIWYKFMSDYSIIKHRPSSILCKSDLEGWNVFCLMKYNRIRMKILGQMFWWCLELQLHQNQWSLTVAANLPFYADAFHILITKAATSLYSMIVYISVVKALTF